jgi:hypothetical protein
MYSCIQCYERRINDCHAHMHSIRRTHVTLASLPSLDRSQPHQRLSCTQALTPTLPPAHLHHTRLITVHSNAVQMRHSVLNYSTHSLALTHLAASYSHFCSQVRTRTERDDAVGGIQRRRHSQSHHVRDSEQLVLSVSRWNRDAKRQSVQR